MTRDEAMARLAALGSERMRAQNAKRGVTGAQFGVMMGDIRKLAGEVKSDHALALELWETGNLEVRVRSADHDSKHGRVQLRIARWTRAPDR